MCKQRHAKTFIDLLEHGMIWQNKSFLYCSYFMHRGRSHHLLFLLTDGHDCGKCGCYIFDIFITTNPGLEDFDCFTTLDLKWLCFLLRAHSLTHSTNFPKSCFAQCTLCSVNSVLWITYCWNASQGIHPIENNKHVWWLWMNIWSIRKMEDGNFFDQWKKQEIKNEENWRRRKNSPKFSFSRQCKSSLYSYLHPHLKK